MTLAQHSHRSTFAACVAAALEVPAADVPLDEEALRPWLGGRGLGLVPVTEPATFEWPGPWIGLRAGPDGQARAVVLYGAPSGVLWDPAGTHGEVLAGWVLAPHDLPRWTAPVRRPATAGTVEALLVGPDAETALTAPDVVEALAGRGLEGDRYAAGRGTFPSGRPGSDLTLADAAVLDELGAQRGAPIDHRRNVVVRGTDLAALIGRRFRLGEAICFGQRPAEPCAHLDRLNGGGILRPLVHRGGLRADIVASGTIRVGDALVPLG